MGRANTLVGEGFCKFASSEGRYAGWEIGLISFDRNN